MEVLFAPIYFMSIQIDFITGFCAYDTEEVVPVIPF